MTTVQVYFLILFIGLILVTFSLGWFTKMVWDNPDIIDEIKNISKQYNSPFAYFPIRFLVFLPNPHK